MARASDDRPSCCAAPGRHRVRRALRRAGAPSTSTLQTWRAASARQATFSTCSAWRRRTTLAQSRPAAGRCCSCRACPRSMLCGWGRSQARPRAGAGRRALPCLRLARLATLIRTQRLPPARLTALAAAPSRPGGGATKVRGRRCALRRRAGRGAQVLRRLLRGRVSHQRPRACCYVLLTGLLSGWPMCRRC